MSTTNDGGQAFPTPETDGYHPVPGMSLRDYFAAHALAAMVTKTPLVNRRDVDQDAWDAIDRNAAESAYGYADAMIVQRSKPVQIPTPKKIRVPLTPEQKEMKQKRRDFAKDRSVQILTAPEDKQRQLWIEAAKDAQKLGLYSPTTYVKDIAGYLEHSVSP